MQDEVEHLDQKIETIAANALACQRQLTVPRIGPLINTAVVGAIGKEPASSVFALQAV